MARQLNATNLRSLGLEVLASSHAQIYDPEVAYQTTLQREGYESARFERQKALRRFHREWPVGTSLNSWRGIALAEKNYGVDPKDPVDLRELEFKTAKSLRQFRQFKAKIQNTPNLVALNIIASNDLKYFTVENEELVPMIEAGPRVWQGLSIGRKVNYTPKRNTIFTKSSEVFISDRVHTYINMLAQMYADSTVEFVFLSSVLERFYADPKKQHHDTYVKLAFTDAYFAMINCCIKAELKKLNNGTGILNRNGKKIFWKFINVAHQFHSAPVLRNIFRKDEIQNTKCSRWVHRNPRAMAELTVMYLEDIHKVLTEKGVLFKR